MPELQLHKISKSFDARQVLRDIDLSVNKGELVCLIRSWGSGKSTLLETIDLADTH